MGIFGKINEATYSDGGVYVLPGVYRFKIRNVLYKRTRQQKDAFIAEFEVLESTNPERPVGSTCSWMVTLDKEPALGNIKQFLAEAMGQPMVAITEQVVEAVISAGNPLGAKGVCVRASAVNIKTKRNTDFTKVKFIRDSAGAAAAEDEFRKG